MVVGRYYTLLNMNWDTECPLFAACGIGQNIWESGERRQQLWDLCWSSHGTSLLQAEGKRCIQISTSCKLYYTIKWKTNDIKAKKILCTWIFVYLINTSIQTTPVDCILMVSCLFVHSFKVYHPLSLIQPPLWLCVAPRVRMSWTKPCWNKSPGRGRSTWCLASSADVSSCASSSAGGPPSCAISKRRGSTSPSCPASSCRTSLIMKERKTDQSG